jgi:hypothetical protein
VEEAVVTPENDRIRRLLEGLAHDEREIRPPDSLERRVLEAWDERHSRPAPLGGHRSLVRPAAWAGLVLAASLAAVLVWKPPAEPQRPAESAPAAVEDTYLQWLDDDPASLQTVRVRATGAALTSMGLPFADLYEGDERVDIELVVGPDGTRRGARLLPQTGEDGF